MVNRASDERIARLVDPRDALTVDVMGPTVQFLTDPMEGDDVPCVMRGTIPPGVSVPLHSHAEPETFLALSGEVEALAMSGDGAKWIHIKPGDVFHVPGEARHAFRNPFKEPAVSIIVSTGRIGRFFLEVGMPPGAARAPTAETVRRFLETADKYGYWNATPEENAKVGLTTFV